MQRDTQRSRVYKCDDAISRFAKPTPSVKDVQRLVRKTFNSKRVRQAYPRAASQWQPPIVKDGRGRRRAGGWEGGITIPIWARNEGVVLHELAHTISLREHGRKIAGHGWEFCSTYLKLVLYMLGREAHDALKAAFKANRVRFNAPRTRKPLDPERRAALVARLETYRASRRKPPVASGRFAGLEL